jgi:hypothetical protein
MFVYNLSLKVDAEIVPEWIIWMREEYIPEVMATGLFDHHKFFKLLEADEDPSASTFVLQYFTDSNEKYTKFINHHSFLSSQKFSQKWKDRLLMFSTLMQTVN